MTVVIISSFCLSLMFIMPAMMQPLSLGLLIMGLSVVSCVLISLFVSSWYGYILFLVYVGGLLVMFAYVAALAPNSFFSGVGVLFSFLVTLLFVTVGLSILFVPDCKEVFWSVNMSESRFVEASGSCIMNPSGMSIIIMLGIILLINLLVIVKICYYQQGPLRAHSELM